MENEISPLYETCSGAAYGNVWTPAGFKSILIGMISVASSYASLVIADQRKWRYSREMPFR